MLAGTPVLGQTASRWEYGSLLAAGSAVVWIAGDSMAMASLSNQRPGGAVASSWIPQGAKFRRLVLPKPGGTGADSTAHLVPLLNVLGADGWELVNVIASADGVTQQFFFKRRRNP